MSKRIQLAAFIFLCGVSIVIWWQPLLATSRLALLDEAYTHILLIVPLAIGLMQVQRGLVLETSEMNVAAGAVPMAMALLIAALARWGLAAGADDLRLSLNMVGLVTWWIGSVVFCLGLPGFRSFSFPLCFLYWVVPVPGSVVDGIMQFLQTGSAAAARALFRIAGVPVMQDGIFLDIPGLSIEVARECSSIRSSMVLIVMTMVLAHLFLRSWWRRSLAIVIAVPLAVAKNGLRIFVIAELTTRVDPAFIDGKLHRQGGILFLAIAVCIECALIWLLRQNEIAQSRVVGMPVGSIE